MLKRGKYPSQSKTPANHLVLSSYQKTTSFMMTLKDSKVFSESEDFVSNTTNVNLLKRNLTNIIKKLDVEKLYVIGYFN